jgi:GntR family galactonate operon transcriptional repressor
MTTSHYNGPSGVSPLRRSLKDQLVEDLGFEIVAGRLRPGDLLPNESVLLARYHVSRTVLRDALNVLSSKGLLDARPKRGTVVRPRLDWSQLDPTVIGWSGAADEDDSSEEVAHRLDQLIEVRHIIEPAAAALAARRGTPEDFSRMADAYSAMEGAGPSVEEFMKADLAFHIACLRASHNDFLLPIAHAIRTAMTTSLRITNRDPEENRNVSLPLHRAILDAVVARNPDAAVAAMERHLEDTKQRRARAGRRADKNSQRTE